MAMTLTADDQAWILAQLTIIQQALVGPMDHDEQTGIDRIFDTDGSTVLQTNRVKAAFTITGANWTNSSKHLVKTGAFTGYLWQTGDVVTLTAGTGLVAGQYVISSKIDDDTIVLATDINAAAGDISDNSIAGEIETTRIMRSVVA